MLLSLKYFGVHVPRVPVVGRTKVGRTKVGSNINKSVAPNLVAFRYHRREYGKCYLRTCVHQRHFQYLNLVAKVLVPAYLLVLLLL